jgi:TRAP-type uncharacterized transport system substrate-binding protein
MTDKEIKAFYDNNKDFKEYVDRFIHNNPEYSLTEALKHKIIHNIADYYKEAGKGAKNE